MASELICSIQDLGLPVVNLLSSQCLVAVKKGIRKLGITNGIPYETECIMILLPLSPCLCCILNVVWCSDNSVSESI